MGSWEGGGGGKGQVSQEPLLQTPLVWRTCLFGHLLLSKGRGWARVRAEYTLYCLVSHLCQQCQQCAQALQAVKKKGTIQWHAPGEQEVHP